MHRPTIRTIIGSCLLVSSGIFAACGSARTEGKNRPRVGPVGRLITQEDIRRSGANNAWEAVRRAGSYLNFRENARGNFDRVLHRGTNSLVLNNQVLLVVDEQLMPDVQYMREIPAPTIGLIQILSGSEGVVRYGTSAGNGVVVVQTQVPQQ